MNGVHSFGGKTHLLYWKVLTLLPYPIDHDGLKLALYLITIQSLEPTIDHVRSSCNTADGYIFMLGLGGYGV